MKGINFMYSYHNRIKERIKNGELIGYKYVDNYNKVGECLLLLFNTYPFERPIRPYRYDEYIDILIKWENEDEKRKLF